MIEISEVIHYDPRHLRRAKSVGRLAMSCGALAVVIPLCYLGGALLLERFDYIIPYLLIIGIECWWLGGIVGKNLVEKNSGDAILYALLTTFIVMLSLGIVTILLNLAYISQDTFSNSNAYILRPVIFILVWGALPCFIAAILWGWMLSRFLRRIRLKHQNFPLPLKM